MTAILEVVPSTPSRSTKRSARWVPWALFAVELLLTAIVIGVLSVVLVVQTTLIPGAILGEYDGVVSFVSWGVTGIIEAASAVVVFLVTGLVVGLMGLPVRFIPPLRRLWLGNGEVTLVGVIVGVALLVVAYVPLGTWQVVELEFGTYPVYEPSAGPLLLGWLLLALSLSLLVWPARWLPSRARLWWVETQLTPRRAQSGNAKPSGTLTTSPSAINPASARER